MSQDSRRLHITFTYSAAHSLKLALKRLGIDEEVLPLGDDLSIGPIEPGDAEQRLAWEDAELGSEQVIADEPATAEFWKRVSARLGTLVAWMSSRCGVEVCGFHALVSRLPSASIDVIDVADVAFRNADGEPAPFFGQSFSIVSDDRIVEHKLIDLAISLDDVSGASIRARWKRLGEEGAALRVLTEQGLVSEPITYFDDRIRARVTADWQSSARVVGDTMTSMSTGRLQEFHSDAFIYCRLLHLVDNDEFEAQNEGDEWSMHHTKVRRRPGR